MQGVARPSAPGELAGRRQSLTVRVTADWKTVGRCVTGCVRRGRGSDMSNHRTRAGGIHQPPDMPFSEYFPSYKHMGPTHTHTNDQPPEQWGVASPPSLWFYTMDKIGRASCRERVSSPV